MDRGGGTNGSTHPLGRWVFENAGEAMFVFDASGAVIDANPAAERSLLTSRPRLLGKKIWDASAAHDRERFAAEIGELLHGSPVEQIVTRTVQRRDDGSTLPVEMQISRIRADGGLICVAIARDPARQTRFEKHIRHLVEGTAGETGGGFFDSLCRTIAITLGVRDALIGERNPSNPKTARTISYWADGRFSEPVQYLLEGVPCAEVLAGRTVLAQNDVRERYPGDNVLKELDAKSYLGTPVRSSGGSVRGLLAVVHDGPIPDVNVAQYLLEIFAYRVGAELERMDAEREVRDHDLRFRQLAEASQDAIWIVDHPAPDRFDPVYVSPAIEQIWGESIGDLGRLKDGWLRAIHREDRKQIASSYKKATSSSRFDIQYRITRPDGEVRWLQDRVFPVPDGHGGVLRVVGITRDITERRKASAELREAQARLQLIAEHTTELLYLQDASGRLLYVSPSTERLTGYPPDEYVRVAADILVTDSPRTAEAIRRWKQRDREAMGDCPPQRVDIRHRDGSIRTHEVRERWITGADGDRLLIGLAVDVTEQLREEERQRNQQEILIQSQKMEAVGQLAAGVVHDFSNLLTAIAGYIAVARDTLEPTHAAAESLSDIADAARQADGIASSLLTFARRRPVVKRALPIGHTVENALRLIRRSISNRITLVVEPDTLGSDQTAVRADETQLQQVLMNLALNARDAMADGGTLTVSLARRRDPELGDAVHLEVRDTGVGMSRAAVSRAFEPFFSTKPRGAGTGLGLSITHAIVTDHGGHVTIRSRLGRGTAVRVSLPVVVDALVEVKPPASFGAGRTALIVEPDRQLRGFVRSTTVELGLEPTALTDLDSACRALAESRFDLAIVASTLPECGRSLLTRLADGPRGVVPTIVLADAGCTAPAAPARVKLTRPFMLADLIEAITVLLGHSGPGPGAGPGLGSDAGTARPDSIGA